MGRRPLCLAALLFVLWIAGIFVTGRAGWRRETPLPDHDAGQSVRIRGQIYRQERKNTNQIYLKNNSILSGTNQESYDFNILIFTDKDISYQIGNILEVTGICQEPESAGNPGQFDMEKWYRAQKIGLLMSKCHITLIDRKTDRFRQTISDVRNRIKESLYEVAEEEEASLMCAMLLGDKNGMEEDVKNLYQNAGISHVLAISGLHISLLGMLFFSAIRKLGAGFFLAGILSGSLTGLYSIMTGMSVSTCRAFLMFLVYLGAQASGRTYDLKSSLALAVLLLLFRNPLLLSEGGFQLSVLAAGGLAYLYPVLKKCIRTKGKLADGMLVSLSVQLAIFPCMLYHFYQFSAMGIFLNLLILPLMSVLLLAGLSSGMIGLVWIPAGIFLFAPCHYILRMMKALCFWSLRVPGARQIWGRPDAGSIFLYYGILLLVFGVLSGAGREKGKLLLCSGMLAFGTAGLPVSKIQGMEMTFLDVGQGDGIFWQTEDGKTFLCDAGSSSVSQVGKYRILPFLKCRGIGKLDYLFLTHMDEDHINGAVELLEAQGEIDVACLVLPALEERDETYGQIERLAERRKIPVLKFQEGMKMGADVWNIECLAPRKGADGTDKNRDSLVLAVQYGSFRALLTGDVEKEGEEYLEESGRAGKISVLKVAHHGSKNSTSKELLEQIRPTVSVISCGRDNSYGHPSKELLERLKDVRTVVYETEKSGAVKVSVNREGFSVQEYRKNNFFTGFCKK